MNLDEMAVKRVQPYSENEIAYQLHAQYNLQIYCELYVC